MFVFSHNKIKFYGFKINIPKLYSTRKCLNKNSKKNKKQRRIFPTGIRFSRTFFKDLSFVLLSGTFMDFFFRTFRTLIVKQFKKKFQKNINNFSISFHCHALIWMNYLKLECQRYLVLILVWLLLWYFI